MRGSCFNPANRPERRLSVVFFSRCRGSDGKPAFKVTENASADDRTLMEQVNDGLAAYGTVGKRVLKLRAEIQQSGARLEGRDIRRGIRYRTVALAGSLALNWNARNIIGCYLSARALVETSAVLFDFEHQLKSAVEEKNLAAIDQLCTNRHFSTRDEKWLEDHPETKAINVLTLIKSMDKRGSEGIRKIYDIMSEYCHPNYLGHHQMFATLDTTTGTTTDPDAKEIAQHSHSIFGAMLHILIVEHCLDRLDSEIDRVSRNLERS